MTDYYSPDPIWLDFKIENQEDYMAKYVIKRNFHSGIRKDEKERIKKSEGQK